MSLSHSEIVKALVYDVVVKAAIKRLLAALPFLSIPVIGPVLSFIISEVMIRLADALYKELSLFVNFVVIDFQTAEQQKEYEKAVSGLKEALEKANAEEIERARKEFEDRLRDLIRFP